MYTAHPKDLKWMRFCVEGAKIFSTCAKQQYMAILVDPSGVIDSSGTPYDHGDGLCYAIHAEMNCLIHSDLSKRKGGTLYVNGVPCFGCAKVLVNSGLGRVVYLEEDFNRDGTSNVLELFEKSKTQLRYVRIKDL